MHTQTHLYIHKCTYNESITKANAATLVLSFFWIFNYFALAFIALFVVYTLFLLFTCCVWFFLSNKFVSACFPLQIVKKTLTLILCVCKVQGNLCACVSVRCGWFTCVCVCFECNLSFCVQLITRH